MRPKWQKGRVIAEGCLGDEVWVAIGAPLLAGGVSPISGERVEKPWHQYRTNLVLDNGQAVYVMHARVELLPEFAEEVERISFFEHMRA
jgi:hypothetical protein